MTKTAVLYARISQSTEESVSVDRQLVSGRKYAEARGWEVVGTFIDDGVSATYNKPQGRAGWKSLMASTEWFDAVVIWKVDRLARRVIDFLQTDEELQSRGAAIVCVEQSIDMTTGEGRAFAQMLAVFGELEGAAISDRNSSTRRHLIQTGRAAGGAIAYGWMSIPNPDGPGLVLAKDPVTTRYMRGMALRRLRGDSLASIVRWLDASGARLPRSTPSVRRRDLWTVSTVARLLRNPLLGGMIMYNPDSGRRGRMTDVLRHPDGSPVIRKDLAILTTAQRTTLIEMLDAKHAEVTRARALRATRRPLLAGLLTCGACEREQPMNYGLVRDGVQYRCPRCRQAISGQTLHAYLEHRLLEEHRSTPLSPAECERGAEPVEESEVDRKLIAIDRALRQLAFALTRDNANTDALTREIRALKGTRTRLRQRVKILAAQDAVISETTVTDLWGQCEDDDQRRTLIIAVLASCTIYRGRRGRIIGSARVELIWRLEPTPLPPEADLGLDEAPAPAEWVSFKQAAELLHCNPATVYRAVRTGAIEQRAGFGRTHPSLARESILRYREMLSG